MSEAAIVTNTVVEAATATPLRNERRNTKRPSSAIHTVAPAKSTARPEVSIDFAAASSGSTPCAISRRYRETIKSA